jgi:Uma2 family endonuclease
VNAPLDLLERPSVEGHEVPEGYELVDGQLVELKMGAEPSWIGARLWRQLDAHCEATKAGWAFIPDAAYRCFPNRKTVRKPDVSFVRWGRFPGERPPRGDATIAPDLVAEVVSPNDLVYELDEKVEQYLAVGVRLVWVINPLTRVVIVHRLDGTMAKVREGIDLDGEDIVPGFRCSLTSFLLPPEGTDGQST